MTLSRNLYILLFAFEQASVILSILSALRCGERGPTIHSMDFKVDYMLATSELVDCLHRVSRKYNNVDKNKIMASDGILCRILIHNEQLDTSQYLILSQTLTAINCMHNLVSRTSTVASIVNLIQQIGTNRLCVHHCQPVFTRAVAKFSKSRV